MSKHTHNLVISSPDNITRVIPINGSIIDRLSDLINKVLTDPWYKTLYISDFYGDKYFIPSDTLRQSVLTIKKLQD